MNNKIIILFLFILHLICSHVHGIFVTDSIAFSKMAIELAAQTRELKKIIAASSKLNEEFQYFKRRFLRIHKGLTEGELKLLLKMSDIEFYYNSPYVRINKNDLWRAIWEDPKNLLKRYKYIKEKRHIYTDKLYIKNKDYRDRVNFKIKEDESILKDYENLLTMLGDTRKIIYARKEKYKNIEKLIKRVNSQGATGKLIAIQNELKIEQIIKLDMLITSLRIKLENDIKEKIISLNISKKNEIDLYLDRSKDEINLRKYLFGK